MIQNNSLLTRIFIGKSIGLLNGAIAFAIVPYYIAGATLHLRVGVFLWYITIGAIIAIFGVINWHPILKTPVPWWIRAPFLGGWMNFVLSLFLYESYDIGAAYSYYLGSFPQFATAMVLEGMIVGFVIGFFATRYGGEGRDIIDVNKTETLN